MAKQKTKYSSDLPKRMYLFFLSYSDGGLPSFRKFASSVGLTLAELMKMRSHREFDRAYAECREIRRDYLIDKALEKRFDSSFAKFLISLENEADDMEESSELRLHLEVKE